MTIPTTRAAGDVFEEHRELLFSIAYRMLGSAADAEDIVQDAYLRWQDTPPKTVRSPRDYLGTIVTRLALDHLRSARKRREVYVGPWLPEPLVGVSADDPLAAATLAESLSTAFLVLLERLSSRQRAAFLLHDVFGYEQGEVAAALQTTTSNARQLVTRARQELAGERARFASDRKRAAALAERFLSISTGSDAAALLPLLSPDAVAHADGGGKFAAARNPIVGADRVARFIAGVVRKWSASGTVRVEPVNAEPGLLWLRRGRLAAVLTLGVNAEGTIDRVFIVVNPDKLHWPVEGGSREGLNHLSGAR